ncbi:hypothetical protein MKW94_015013 [Papaver nudicaule]|uniref:Uncharacterized protein n=1 Tax=Papaver nudicaule TaxID=74823 RepID=A0AA41VHT6_PAPNU|nr:hypothetical protein [Papaver nudicaule]
MEEEISLSLVSNTTTLNDAEGREVCSDSNSSKRQSQFKGVVHQPNGTWGAQIYKNRERTWIGTFKSESEAAKAYDSVAVKLRSDEDLHRNYPLTSRTSLEADFLKPLSMEQVKDMFRDGSYEQKFDEFLNKNSLKGDKELNLLTGSASDRAVTFQRLFHKVLTPSDVGKLNRLVIPKMCAEHHFPPVSKEEKEAGVIEDIQLSFYDREMTCWKFRYCFWRSSQSYVFTRGWSRFVKIKKLKAGDVVTFYWCECQEGQKAFYMIDVGSNGDESGGGSDGNRVDLQLGTGQITTSNESGPSDRSSQVWKNKGDNVIMEVAPPQPQEEKKAFRLFGVNIS